MGKGLATVEREAQTRTSRAAQDKEQHALQRVGGAVDRRIPPHATASRGNQSQIYGEEHLLSAQAPAVSESEHGAARAPDTGTADAVHSELRVTLLGGERGGAPDPGTNEPDIGGIGKRRGGTDTGVMGGPATTATARVSGDNGIGALLLAGYTRRGGILGSRTNKLL